MRGLIAVRDKRMHSTLPINICKVRMPDGFANYVTLTPIGATQSRGIAPQEIVGQLLQGESLKPDNFARNRAFVDFLHEVIRKHGSSVQNLILAAQQQGDGWVHILDARTPTPQGSVPPEDVIGAFQVAGGKLVTDTYRANPNHRILSENGFFQLEPLLQQRLLEELAACA